MRQAEYCGIKIELRTHIGDHPLVVEVRHAEGWNAFFQTMVHVGRAGEPAQLSEYEKWCQQHEALEEDDLPAIRRHIASFRSRPVISVVMPVYNPPEGLLAKAIQSVVDQVYPHWELCIADDASTEAHVRQVMEGFAAKDPRVRTAYRPVNGHICEATNTALGIATGEFVALFDHDDVLSPMALYEVAAEVDAHPKAQLIYTDEDKIDMEDRRFDPYFKPDWNPDLNYAQNYVSHLSVYRTELVRSLGGFRKGFEGSQDWDLLLRAIERIPPSAIRHIPKLLYHWRAAPGSTALQLAEKSYPVEAARMALEDHFRRKGETVEMLPVPGDHWRIKYPLPSPAPLVSLIIPTRNALKLVRQAVKSILEVTDYPNYEILIVDNDSDDPETLAYFAELDRGVDPRLRVLRCRQPFNYSAINNFAVREARGDIIGFLNNDVEAIGAGWLTEMVSHAVRAGIGAVGAMLYYPLNTVQHAGVVLGLGGVAGHPFKEFPRGDQGQKNRLRLVQNYSAVTAACLVVRKERFLEVGGFNERDLPIAFNDVDLCCKLLAAGYRNLWTPHAEFYHHESATRGVEDTPEKKARFQSEIDYMMNTWGTLLMADPAYNPNLTLVGEDFSPAYLSRAAKSWTAHLP
jgi:glycosyltransferase involved in cell wall biosynthesis